MSLWPMGGDRSPLLSQQGECLRLLTVKNAYEHKRNIPHFLDEVGAVMIYLTTSNII